MRTRIGGLVLVVLVLLASACASVGRTGRRDLDVLTQAEMQKDNFITVYDAVSALRSNWLNVRPNTLTSSQEDVVVYYDVTRLGSPDQLKNVRVSDIAYVRHYTSTEATQRFGVGHSQGVILVSSHAQ